MKSLRSLLLTLVACAALHAQCVSGGLAVVVPKTNPTDGLSMAQLRKLVLGDVHSWPDKTRVTLVSTDQEGAAFRCLLNSVVRMSLPEYRKYLLSAEFRGDEPLHARTVESSQNALRAIAGFAGAISVVEAGSVASLDATLKVLTINGKHPGEPGYPLL